MSTGGTVTKMVITYSSKPERRSREAGDVRECLDGRLLICRLAMIRTGPNRGCGIVTHGRHWLEWVEYGQRHVFDAPTFKLPRGTRLVRATWRKA